MQLAAWSVLGYALLIAIGGLFAHLKAHSTASLVTSIPFTIALAACLPGLFKAKRGSFYCTLGILVALQIFFVYRFIKTGSWMPAGMLTVITFVTLITVSRQLARGGGKEKGPATG